MAYTKTTWADLPSTSTPINATNLNKMEEGIYENATVKEQYKNLFGGGKKITANRDSNYPLNSKLPAGTYTMSWGTLTKTSSENPLFQIRNSGGTVLAAFYLDSSPKTFTMSGVGEEYRFYPAANYNSSSGQTATLENIQIEAGETATTFNDYRHFINESGSNTNGRYIKYSDGTMICWNSVRITGNFTTAVGPFYYNGTGTDIVYPVEFYNQPTVSISGLNSIRACYLVSNSTTGFKTVAMTFDSSSSVVGYLFYIAIGRWKA